MDVSFATHYQNIVECIDNDPIETMEARGIRPKLHTEVVCQNETNFFEEAAAKIGNLQLRMKEKNDHGKKRAFHAKGHLCITDAKFIVMNDELKKRGISLGPIFSENKEYKTAIRYSNGQVEMKKDSQGDFRGLAFKLNNYKDSIEQDFLMLSNPSMAAGSGKQFMDFVEATTSGFFRQAVYAITQITKGTKVGKFLINHVIKNTPKRHPSLASRNFWSGSAFKFGDQTIHYMIKPISHRSNSRGDYLNNYTHMYGGKKNYYRAKLFNTLANEDIRLGFYIQFQENATEQPIEDSSVTWDEEKYKPIKIGEIVIDKTRHPEFAGTKASKGCEALKFDPWNTTEFHAPLGSINRIRKPVYKESQLNRSR